MNTELPATNDLKKPLIALGFGVVGVISMFLGWVATGQRVRSSFNILDAAVGLPIDIPFVGLVETLWLFLPALALAGPMLVIAGYSRTGWTITFVFHAVLGLAALATTIRLSPQIGNILALIVIFGFFLYLGTSSLFSKRLR